MDAGSLPGENLWLEEARGDAVVAVELNVVECCGNTEPTWHGSGFGAADVRHSGNYDIAEAQRAAHKDDFKFDGKADGELARAKEKNASGTDVSGDKSDGGFFRDAAGSAKAKREIQAGARVFTVLGMDADSVCWDSNESAGMRRSEKRGHAKSGNARGIENGLRSDYRFARLYGGFGRPRFQWIYALGRAHAALRDATSQSLATSQQDYCETDFLEFPRPHTSGVERYDVIYSVRRQPVENERSVLTSNTWL
jgi:hypothetical protein